MKGSDLFVRCLENEGVEYIFGIPGEETLDFMDSLSRSDIEFIVVRHEQSAAFMADAYGRLVGRPGVCLSTLGPGATNLITGVADAHLDRAPLVAITGQGSLDRAYKESHQILDVVGLFDKITSWNAIATAAHQIPELVGKAFDIATDVPGATHIELPEDVASQETDAIPLEKKSYSHSCNFEENELHKALEMISGASKPLIIAGNGVIRENASAELEQFVDASNIGVVTTFMGKGAISADNDHFIGSMGMSEKDYIMCGLDVADVVITVGFDSVEYSPDHWNKRATTKIIHVHTRHPEIESSYIPECALIGSLKTTLKAMLHKIHAKEFPKYYRNIKVSMENELLNYRDDPSFPMKPQRIIWEVRQILDRGDILVSDVGAHKLWIGRLYPAFAPNTVLMSNGLASMGFALPAAIASCLVHPEKKIVAISGDAGFLMNLQDLETAVRLDCDLVIVIFDDSSYGLIEWECNREFGSSFGTTFKNPDFVELAHSFGARGVRVRSANELSNIFQDAFNEGGVWLVDVPVDYSENLKLTSIMEGK
ncbi:MAG: acetolactate synthase large subunit [Methanohalophilus sp.]|nr:acetolactate synthase large subunit [Methanohalophilus sp.]